MTFEYTPTEDGFRIRDTIENSRTELDVGRSVDPTPGDVDRFRVPLDDAIEVETRELRFAEHFGANVHTADGDHITRLTYENPLDLQPGAYGLNAWFPHFTLYLHVADAAISAEITDEGTRVAFDAPTVVTIGLRSFHQRPAGTVTATQDPRDLMRAISTFGSSLKTLSPERAFPTLRGHPPEVAIRGQCSIPDAFAPPDTGITLEVPPDYAAIFTVAPLAYYFGATVEPGLTPRLVTDGAVHEFDTAALATSTNRLLRHCLLLDCVVRTEGLYPIDLYERTRVEARTDIDPATLYALPIDERTARYLDVPFEATDGLLEWPYIADIDPTPLNAEALPYLSFRLAAIRSPPAGRTARQDTPTPSPPTTEATDTRSFLPGDQSDTATFVTPEPFDAQQHLWVGNGIPVDGVKPTLGSYLRSIDSSPKDASIEHHVVSVDGPSQDEIESRYRVAGVDPETLAVHEDPTTSELRDILMADIDYLHYRGNVTSNGLACLDGPLDIRTLPRVGVCAFLLEGADSAQQGLSLIHAGGIAGIVTLGERDASRPCGCALGALLDAGFPLSAGANILTRIHSDMTTVVVGDGDHQISTGGGLPVLTEACSALATDDTVTLRTTGFPTTSHRVGTLIETVGTDTMQPRLTGTHDIEYTREQIDRVAAAGEEPLIVDQELYWLDELSADELWRLLR